MEKCRQKKVTHTSVSVMRMMSFEG